MPEDQQVQAAAAADTTAQAAASAQAPAQVATQITDNPAAASAPAAGQQAQQEPNKAAQAQQATFGEAVTYNSTGNSNLDLALAFAGKHGLGPEHAAMQAASKGDFGPLKALFSEKGVPGWEAHIALAENGFKEHVRSEAEKTIAIQNICVEAAGGDPEEWGRVLTWASSKADPEEKPVVNAALAQGGIAAQAMANYLVNLFRNDPEVSYSPTSAVKADAGRQSVAPSGGPLSPAEYKALVPQLRQKYGPDFEQTPEYKQIAQRRLQWRG